jgi:hypothetical protein
LGTEKKKCFIKQKRTIKRCEPTEK